MTFLYIILGVFLAIVLYVWYAYNGLVRKRNQVKSAWSDIDVQMRRRYDLIPNLVETVKGYATQEREVLENVVKARNMAMNNNGTAAEQGESENFLTGALKSLFALAEAYPDLKSDQNFRELQQELSEIEETIQRARRFYNGAVEAFNNMIEQFPSNLVAKRFGFTQATFFELDDEAARQPVKVEFQ